MNYNPNFNYPYGNFNNYNQPNINQYAFVNGIEGAKSYQMQPNQIVMLLDSDKPVIYKKTANAYGQATIECFKMVSISEEELKGTNTQPQVEYALKSDFEALKQRIDDILKDKEVKDNA